MPELWGALGDGSRGTLAALHFGAFAIPSSRQPPAMRKDFKTVPTRDEGTPLLPSHANANSI